MDRPRQDYSQLRYGLACTAARGRLPFQLTGVPHVSQAAQAGNGAREGKAGSCAPPALGQGPRTEEQDRPVAKDRSCRESCELD